MSIVSSLNLDLNVSLSRLRSLAGGAFQHPAWERQAKVEESKEKVAERSRKIFEKPSPQLLWINLFIRLPCHQNMAHFSTFNTSLPKK
ncbi:MAG: hypothetical protein ACREJN_13650 [Nitrospiraceae bacterium]